MGWVKSLGPLGPLAVLALVVPPVSGMVVLGTLNRLGPWLRDHQELGMFFYLAGFTILGGLALLPTYAQSMLGGWAFGVAVGVPVALVGFVGASLVGYVVARRLSGDRAERLLAQHRKWDAVYAALMRSGFWRALAIVTLLRLPPNSPFAASNLTMAALRVPLIPYLLGTAIGLAPRTSAVVYAGAGLSSLDFADRQQTGWFFGGLALTFLALGGIGWMANRALRRVEARAGMVGPSGP
jgi:uncharacterized membrane protein YdjX (TVP38/TMEM64 family)